MTRTKKSHKHARKKVREQFQGDNFEDEIKLAFEVNRELDREFRRERYLVRRKEIFDRRPEIPYDYTSLIERSTMYKYRDWIISAAHKRYGRAPCGYREYKAVLPPGVMDAELSGEAAKDAKLTADAHDPRRHTCATCASITDLGTPLHGCAHCRRVHYCCKECQRQDWPQHKAQCVIDRKARLDEHMKYDLEDNILCHRNRMTMHFTESIVDAGYPYIIDMYDFFVQTLHYNRHRDRNDALYKPRRKLLKIIAYLHGKLDNDELKVLKITANSCARVICRFFRKIRKIRKNGIRKLAVVSKLHQTFYNTAATDALDEIQSFL
uniref:MYND-type domain-containing protein n=1 Tax=viral metagenome TaxID=1070528 RepID=A0A6C0K9U5_9ZZZZ